MHGCVMQELRIEDCTSDSSAEPAPWEDTMRLMPPLLELADMFNIILRRCRNSRADSDLVRGMRLLQLQWYVFCAPTIGGSGTAAQASLQEAIDSFALAAYLRSASGMRGRSGMVRKRD